MPAESRFVLNTRNVGAALAMMAVLLLLEGALTRSWWAMEQRENAVTVDMGMTSSRVCIEGNCRVLPHEKLAGVLGSVDDRVWLMAGAAAAWGAFVVVGFLLASGLLSWRGRTKAGVLVAQITTVLCGLLLVWAALYVFLRPAEPNATVRMGHSVVTYFLGAICGFAAGLLLARVGERAEAPTLGEVFD